MMIDMLGKKRYRVNLHTHTTVSDGKLTPQEAIALYRANGYDAIALTDHWQFQAGGLDANGLLVLSGIEYDTKNTTTKEGLFHILGLGMSRDPHLAQNATAQEMLDAIHSCGGTAVLAHPAWSLNSPEQILSLHGIDATEIYNSVSNVHMSRRPDSSLIVDMLGAKGFFLPLVADDDTHYYDGDECYAWIMVEAQECTQAALLTAIKEKKFYATQGPEIHAWREGDEIVVRCSPCQEIVFFSDTVWCPRVFTGDGITQARYRIDDRDSFVRVQITDANRKSAYTNCITL